MDACVSSCVSACGGGRSWERAGRVPIRLCLLDGGARSPLSCSFPLPPPPPLPPHGSQVREAECHDNLATMYQQQDRHTEAKKEQEQVNRLKKKLGKDMLRGVVGTSDKVCMYGVSDQALSGFCCPLAYPHRGVGP